MRITLAALVSVLLVTGCTDTSSFGDTDGGCAIGTAVCENNAWKVCLNGTWTTQDCGKGYCLEPHGCRLCEPDTKFCVGQDVYQCSKDGTAQTKLKSCRADQQCVLGECLDFCDLPLKQRSNVGCEFWAVDLPNEYYCTSIDQGASCIIYGCGACQQFAVAIANTSSFNVTVTVHQNDALPGQPQKLSEVAKKVVKAYSLEVFNLPMREVDCSTWQKDKTGKLRRITDSQTCLSSKAYRIKSTYPVVAYQFNPIVNVFSNGASLLIPINGLDDQYLVMGWPTTNPISIPMPGKVMEGTPDYTNLTVVGTQDNTKVEVTLAHMTQGSKDKKIPAAKKGEKVSVTLGPFDVLNINSRQDIFNPTGDLTGSLVTASKPVVVFSGAQRASVPYDLKNYSPKPPTPSGQYDVCCTEHFEQQMFPISSLGKEFVITRTPVRSTSSIVEPDFYRILATKGNTTITTSLSNFPKFTLNVGEQANFWSTGDFIVQSSEPIMIAQYAVAQGFVDKYKVGGDPEFVVFPPAEQYRKDYIFLTPTTFTKDYVIIAAPNGTPVKLDSVDVNKEFSTVCERFSIGTLGTQKYVSLRCPVKDGVHRIEAENPVGIMVYGYYGVGSYGYPGGADVKQINIVK